MHALMRQQKGIAFLPHAEACSSARTEFCKKGRKYWRMAMASDLHYQGSGSVKEQDNHRLRYLSNHVLSN